MARHFTEPTTGYWQHIVPADAVDRTEAPWQFGYPARLPDGRVLVLPIRQLAGEPSHAVASLLVNHASLDVVETLGAMLAARLSAQMPELVIGLPTLGLALAPVVARALGHARYVPMGYSRKFWYDEALSAPVHSITSPTPGKRVYLDPNLRPLIDGKRLVLVDDAVSTGTTLLAAWDLIESLGGNVIACGVAMLQGRRWIDRLGAERAARVVGVFESPLLKAVPDGWVLRD
ncbi:Adenine/guanine phosphoribosyltransferases and related PRPP-binding proteins [Variovorax sp. HW608]|uniref:phosphoribosyltransferase n=1 Tax=Variovorax sp. HW608 TaxID=1034889 RepID=UPI00081FE861|nr:phosphoribosyltransferase [Variovorax sp. HW608]SCK23622.1 Adenine/guanine phosphoribosyltransferases and related PRPP-binding proteins [Variovorax sp. HW608]